MRHVMVDIETLGTKPGSVILSIGAVEFDEEQLGARFYRAIDVFDSMMQGLTVDPATAGWWRMQPAETRAALQPAHPLVQAINEFDRFLGRPDDLLLWAKGPDFDLVLLEAVYTLLGRKRPWNYRNARDVRTMLALAPGAAGVPPSDMKHHALGDAEYQARQVMVAASDLNFPLSEMV